MRSAKGAYPWRIGATSCVRPGDILSNARLLALLVDDIQLLFFESEKNSLLPQPLDVKALAGLAEEHALSFTVHLPSDLTLGASAPARRREGIGEILRLMERLAPLAPAAFDLHLNPEPELNEADWLDNLASSLAGLAEALGPEKRRVAVENIAYPFAKVAPLALQHGFGFCLDIGHLVHHGHDLEEGLALLPKAVHLHYHGVENGRDHQALGDAALTRQLAAGLAGAGYNGVLTLEMYRLERLQVSLALLDEAWQLYRR